MWIFSGILMENSKGIGWYLNMDCACDAFSFSMDAMYALSCCLFVYLNVTLQLPTVPRDACITLPALTYHDVSLHCCKWLFVICT